MSSQSDINAEELRYRTIEEVSRLTGRIQRISDNLTSEISLDLYRGLRAGVRAVVHSFEDWSKRSLQ